MAEIIQGSFSGGELSPNLYSRVDLARWMASLKLCRNWVTMPHGGTKTRRGTRFVTVVKPDANPRPVNVLPFQFNADQGYLLEMGHLYMRVLQNGAPIIPVAAPVWVTGTAYAIGDRCSDTGINFRCTFAHTSGLVFEPSDYWVEESVIGVPLEVATPFDSSEVMSLGYVQSADVLTIVHPNHTPYTVKRYGVYDWRVEAHELNSGPFEALNTDNGKTVWLSGATGRITIYASQPIFTEDREGGLFYIAQDGFSQPWESGKTVALGDIRRSDGKYYEAATAGPTGTLRPTHLKDVWSDGGVAWRYLNSGFGVARIIEVAADGESCTADVLTTMPNSCVTTGYGPDIMLSGTGSLNGKLTLIASGGHGVPAGTSAKGLVVLNVRLDFFGMKTYTFTDVIQYVNATTLVATTTRGAYPYYDTDMVAFQSGNVNLEGALLVGASDLWAFGAWSEHNGYPSCVTYHQGRRVYAGSPGEPQTVWLSRSDVYDDFSESTPLQADDALTVSLVSGEINPIKGLLSLGRLLVFTSGAYWTVGNDGKTPLSVDTLLPDLQSYTGASGLRPLGVAESALFTHDGGASISDVTYSFTDDKHIAEDLNLFADHLTDGYTITGWAYQRRPFGIVWCVRSDGTLLGLTYNRRQVVAGWHQHDTRDGAFEACAVVRESGREVLYVVVNRTGRGRCIEYFGDLDDISLDTGIFTDATMIYDANDKVTLTHDSNTYDHTATTLTLPAGTWDESDAIVAVASGPLFYARDLGAELRVAGRRLTIEEILSTTQARVRPDAQIVVPTGGAYGTSWLLARKRFSCDTVLTGTVSALVDGSAELGITVTTPGEVVTSRPGLRVSFGIPIEADLETLELAAAQGETLVTKRKRIGKVSAQVVNSRGLMAGRTFDKLESIKELMPTLYNQAPDLRTGIVSVSIQTSVGTNGSIVIRQKYPLPACITSLIPEVEVSGA